MKTDLPDTDLSLRGFATAFYAKPSIQSACLTLQDQYGVNVPLLLCCCWAGLYFDRLPEPLVKKLQNYTHSYSKQTIVPLREIRKLMKNSHDQKWPIKETDWQSLRENIKKVELDAEYLLLKGLESLVNTGSVKLSEAYEKIQQKEIIKVNGLTNITVCFEPIDLSQETAVESLNRLLDVITCIEDG